MYNSTWGLRQKQRQKCGTSGRNCRDWTFASLLLGTPSTISICGSQERSCWLSGSAPVSLEFLLNWPSLTLLITSYYDCNFINSWITFRSWNYEEGDSAIPTNSAEIQNGLPADPSNSSEASSGREGCPLQAFWGCQERASSLLHSFGFIGSICRNVAFWSVYQPDPKIIFSDDSNRIPLWKIVGLRTYLLSHHMKIWRITSLKLWKRSSRAPRNRRSEDHQRLWLQLPSTRM